MVVGVSTISGIILKGPSIQKVESHSVGRSKQSAVSAVSRLPTPYIMPDALGYFFPLSILGFYSKREFRMSK